MTIPMVVMITAGIIWLLVVAITSSREVSGQTTSQVIVWLGDAARLVFFAAVFVTLMGVTGKPAFD